MNTPPIYNFLIHCLLRPIWSIGKATTVMKYLTIFNTIANSINDEFVFSCGVLNDGGVTRHLSMAAPRQKILADFGNGFREPAGLGTQEPMLTV